MLIFRGRITSVGFDCGNSIVIGDWKESPLGEFYKHHVVKTRR